MPKDTTAAAEERAIYSPNAMTIFAFAWAAQQLFHLAFFSQWREGFRPLAWILLALALAVFLFPGRLRLFLAMLAASIAYYTFDEWPFVSNHVLIDSLINLVILGAAGSVLKVRCFTHDVVSEQDRNAIFAMFAPVLGAIFVIMYYSIIISKLNEAFFDLELSCMTMMYSKFAVFNPVGGLIASVFDIDFLFALFIAIEVLLPVLLTVRKTRLLAVYLGIPLHVLLGLMGHPSFSSFMIALYLVVAMPAFLDLAQGALRRLSPAWTAGLIWAFRSYVALVLLMMATSALTGSYANGPFGMQIYFAKVQWLIWAVILGSGILVASLRSHYLHGPLGGSGATLFWSSRPGWVWMMVLVVVINSASPYIGFKTETSVAMYSNLRTEGGMNNHFFMPTLRIFNFQDDLVEVLESNDPVIQAKRSRHATYDPYRNQHDILVTYFEFRRTVSGLVSEDLEIIYRRNGELRHFKRGDPSNPDQDLDKAPSFLLAKIAFFRPIFKGDKVFCLH